MTTDLTALLRNRKFTYLWTSQVLSQLTIQVMNFLIIVRLFERTGSTIATSLIWLAYSIPAIIIGPLAAAWVDIWDRRMVLIITNLLQCLTILFYAFTWRQYFFLSYAVVMVYSFFNQFYVPAEAASLPALVKRKSLVQANGLFFLTQEASIVLGFGLAGVLNELIGFKISFLLVAFFLFIAFASVSLLPAMKPKTAKVRGFEEGVANFAKKIAEGYQFIKNNHDVLLPFLLLASLHVAVLILSVNLPIMATQIIKISPNLAGPVIVIPAGVGALAGILLLPRFLKNGGRKKTLIERSLFALSLCVWLFAFLVPEITVRFNLRVIVCALIFLVVGASLVGAIVPAQTYLQERTPKHLMGRVFGNFWFVATIAAIFPVLFASAISELFGVRMLFFLLGLGSLIAFIYSTRKGQEILEKQPESVV